MTQDLPQIPGFELIRLIRKGGMGAVYLAEQKALRRSVALKVTLPFLADIDPTFPERFAREAVATANLAHPNIIRIHDAGDCEGYSYLAMEWVAAGTLKDMLDTHDGRFDPAWVCETLAAICDGLGAAHRAGYIHRDIKPDNILMRDGLTPLVTDFGIAKAISDNARLTQTVGTIGSPHYMSPEQLRGEPIDPRADLYSVGVLLFELLERRVPFDGDSAFSIYFQHLTAEPPRAGAENEIFVPLLTQLLSKQPDERPGTAEAVSAALRDLIPHCRPGGHRPVFREEPVPATNVKRSHRVERESAIERTGAREKAIRAAAEAKRPVELVTEGAPREGPQSTAGTARSAEEDRVHRTGAHSAETIGVESAPPAANQGAPAPSANAEDPRPVQPKTDERESSAEPAPRPDAEAVPETAFMPMLPSEASSSGEAGKTAAKVKSQDTKAAKAKAAKAKAAKAKAAKAEAAKAEAAKAEAAKAEAAKAEAAKAEAAKAEAAKAEAAKAEAAKAEAAKAEAAKAEAAKAEAAKAEAAKAEAAKAEAAKAEAAKAEAAKAEAAKAEAAKAEAAKAEAAKAEAAKAEAAKAEAAKAEAAKAEAAKAEAAKAEAAKAEAAKAEAAKAEAAKAEAAKAEAAKAEAAKAEAAKAEAAKAEAAKAEAARAEAARAEAARAEAAKAEAARAEAARAEGREDHEGGETAFMPLLADEPEAAPAEKPVYAPNSDAEDRAAATDDQAIDDVAGAPDDETPGADLVKPATDVQLAPPVSPEPGSPRPAATAVWSPGTIPDAPASGPPPLQTAVWQPGAFPPDNDAPKTGASTGRTADTARPPSPETRTHAPTMVGWQELDDPAGKHGLSTVAKLAIALVILIAGGAGVYLLAPTGADIPENAGTLIIDSQPVGASVTIAGRSFGETPVRIPNLDADKVHLVELEKPGYAPTTRSKPIEKNQDNRLFVTLQKLNGD